MSGPGSRPGSRLERARVVAVGDELLAGAHPDLNSPAIAGRLAGLGIPVRGVDVVGDDEAEIAAAVRRALAPGTCVVVTGGLGPTLDDVTREGVAAAAGVELAESPEARRAVAEFLEHRGRTLEGANLRQARLPRGAELLPNRVGTAPGFVLESGGGLVAVLPGPPHEMRVLLEEELVPRLAQRGEAGLSERRFHLFGIPESQFADRIGARMARGAEPLIGCTVKRGVLSVVVRGRDPAALEESLTFLRTEFAAHVFSEEEPHLERVLVGRLAAAGVSLTTAESCTGGLVATLVTSVPGASAVFREGFVTYSNEAKRARLGVPAELLERHGAVSGPVALAMARGAAERSGARLAIAVTGVAGPDGGTPEKPVGRVHFATSLDGEVRGEERTFPMLGRQWIRDVAARTALFLALGRVGPGGASG